MGWTAEAHATIRVRLLPKGHFQRVLVEAFQTLGWRIHESAPARVVAKSGLGWFSWGETIEAELGPANVVKIRSTCVWPPQAIDFGQNNLNIQKIQKALARYI